VPEPAADQPIYPALPEAGPDPGAVRYAILGPLEVRDHGVLVPIPRPRLRAALVLLLLHAGKPVGVDQLVDGLWGDEPPRTARGQVHTVISGLRQVLPTRAAGDLSLEGSGYRLLVADGALDSERFARGVADARRLARDGAAAEAVRELRAGLGLWRGGALSGVEAPFAVSARTWLDEERFSAWELLADLELALGDHVLLVPEFTALLGEYPSRESIAERLALALYRSGRQADALAVIRSVRELLADEFGLDLGRGLAEVEKAVLNGGDVAGGYVPATAVSKLVEPAPAAPKPAPAGWTPAGEGAGHPRPAQLPPPAYGFVGRAAEFVALSGLLELPPGEPRAAIVAGPAGVGKTSLAVRWAHSVADRFPDGQLFVDLHGYDEGERESADRVLERFLLALGVPGYQIPADQEQREGLYRSCVTGRRLLVLLDNASGYDQVRPLLPGSTTALTLVTSRGRLGGLAAQTGALSVPLGVLPLPEAVEALGKLAGADRVAAEPAAARELARLSGGLPLALRISAVRLSQQPATLLADLAAELAPEEDRLAGLGLPADDYTVSRALDYTYRRLEADQARFFRLLCAHPGADIGAPAAGALCAADTVSTASASLASLEAVHLVEQRSRGRYALHDLVRLYGRQLPEGGPDERGRALTRLFDWHIGAAAAGQQLLNPALVAGPLDLRHPWGGPVPFADREGALDWFRLEDANLLALTRQAAALADHRATWQLARTYSTYLMHTHQIGVLLETQRLGERAADELGLDLAAAGLAANTAIGYSMLRDLRARPAYERALAVYRRVGDLQRVARTTANLGSLYLELGLRREAAAYQREALEAGRALGDHRLVASTLANLGLIETELGDHDTARDLLAEAVGLAAGDEPVRDVLPVVRGQLALVLHRLGRSDEGLALSESVLAAARRDGNPLLAGRMLDQVGEILAAGGRTAEAIRHWRQAVEVLDGIGSAESDVVRERLAAALSAA
jgi:DNA-binding SARP family transcriptional activator/tetratricopeptide (TPR) repeat protein